MTVLVEINVVLDVLLNREPFADASAALWEAIESGRCKGLLPAHAFPTIYYLIHKERGSGVAKRSIRAMRTVFAVAAVDGEVIDRSLDLDFTDFEDAVTAAAAEAASADYLLTRDSKGFRNSPVSALPPEAFLAMLERGDTQP